jgi:phosphopantothenoylcysteine decarboxylase/phosphopantothenate--cysteine ligase
MRVLVGITGGIAAYKSAELIRLFVEAGHEVRAVPTSNALRFIGAATLEALTHNSVNHDLYSDVEEVRHIELAKWADLVVVAPATASFLARYSAGLADDLLGNILLATVAPVVVAPAMHTEMWLNEATVNNVTILRTRGIHVIEPAAGRLTGRDTGVGRLPEPGEIYRESMGLLAKQDLAGLSILVVAGGTREPIDPVRYIGNRSSGKQGVALAEAAVARGASVHLVACNFEYENRSIDVIPAETPRDVESILRSIGSETDIVIMPAAISDYRVAEVASHKIKSEQSEALDLHLLENPDLIANLVQMVGKNQLSTKVVGFAAETAQGTELLSLAQKKLAKKQLDLIVANDVSEGRGFDQTENSVMIVSSSGHRTVAGSKREIADAIFDELANSN